MTRSLSPEIVILALVGYFALLLAISLVTSRNASSEDFFVAGRKSPWLLVAIGMIGASLSGVTFISIPGAVGNGQLNNSFSYMQVVFGYLLGYLIIGTVLLPLYYRLKLTTIYTYLEQRLGWYSYKTGAAFFLLSRLIGASFRLFLVAIVLHQFAFGPLGAPFYLTVAITLMLIYVYTFRGGIKTIVYTDVFQTVAMIAAVILTVKVIGQEMGLQGFRGIIAAVQESSYSKMIFLDGGWEDPNNFFKQFFSGALIAIAMTGLDQDMMQKNLSCRNIGEAQKNMLTFSIILVFVNLLFLTLGVLLYLYAAHVQMEMPRPDLLFPTIAFEYLPPLGGIVFILGLVAAAYSSADSALTALTTSFCVDFLNFEKSGKTEKEKRRTRFFVHNVFALVMLVVIVWFKSMHNDAVINGLFKAAGYTYGPLLGLFAFGLLTKRAVKDRWVVFICLLSPVLSFLVDKYSANLMGGLNLGFLILALNGALTFIGLWLISYSKSTPDLALLND
ncbi:MAG: sodium:solute symporter [Saprospirales bacterium]|nr:sodium:solute symporter [Saprospirales bacterium]